MPQQAHLSAILHGKSCMLAGYKVLELASVLAGPSVGQFFAELGAEVIKVENLKTGGDITRTWKGASERTDDRSAYFCSVNWGKKSVALDLTTADGQRAVQKLAFAADIVIASFKPGDADKLGVAYQQLQADNPRLIYGQITGYGSDNDRVGYDAVLQAETGFMDLNGEPDGAPTKMPVALVDVLAAHHLKEALLAALLQRERTGHGCLVEVSLVHAALSSLANQASNWLVARQLPQRQGSAHPNIAPYGDSFVTADGKRVLLAVGSNRQFADLCNVLQVGALARDERFHSNQQRVKNRGALNTVLASEIGRWPSDGLMKQIHALKIPAGLIQNVEQALDMKEADAIQLSGDSLKGLRNFVAMGLSVQRELLPPPHFGEHTSEILSQL
jgi:crotonobetainyl-CoA:carnitine CoA-transferase CaiB-like acyl-CoA transferase